MYSSLKYKFSVHVEIGSHDRKTVSKKYMLENHCNNVSER